MIICVVYPVMESRNALKIITMGLGRDLIAVFGAKRKTVLGVGSEPNCV